jgi:hypothetical protein
MIWGLSPPVQKRNANSPAGRQAFQPHREHVSGKTESGVNRSIASGASAWMFAIIFS